uniref:Uncharacterized protein n=1 Tax=Mastacembelus armatus TaxID=205130 RepID=A0A3Q3LCK7_9TELE
MENWKIQLVVVTFCALVQIYQGLSFSEKREEPGFSKDWQDETLGTGLTHPIATLMKRSKALRFYGLMGKRSGNKEETFVGLMGRSIFGGGEHKYYEIISKY